MSYNGYSSSNHNYSPYAYQPTAPHDSRSQYHDQPRGNDGYQSGSYQPLSAYQSFQRPQSTAPQSTSVNAYSSQGYNSLTGSNGGAAQDSRAGYTDARSSVDTTALGNLAYASSLGRESSSQQQSWNYGRAQNTSGYGTSNPYGANSGNSVQYGTGHGRTDSGASLGISRDDGSRSQQATTSPSFGFSANNGNTARQAQYPRVGDVGQAQSRQNYHHGNQPARPSSGQAVRQPASRGGSQGVASPTVSTTQASTDASATQLRRGSAVSSGYDGTRVLTPQQSTKPPSNPTTSNGPRAGIFNPSTQSGHSHTTARPANSSRPGVQSLSKQSPRNQTTPSVTPVQHSDHQTSQTTTPTTTTAPATVDPSQVFNHVEYHRRQAAAAAEVEAAKKKAEDARLAASRPQPSAKAPDVPASNDTDADSAIKNRMELEMKQMIEKMRDYKSKDPSLFSQIWEQVKKGRPAGQTSSQQPAAQKSSTSSPIVSNGQLASPITGQSQLPPESELPAADVNGAFPPNFDRGRFPAQRRRRGGANFTPPRHGDTPKGSKTTPGVSATTNFADHNSMQRAMQDFHRNSNSPIPSAPPSTSPITVHVSGKYPGQEVADTSKSTGTPTPASKSSEPPKAGGTYWPESKKRALAEAAKVALTSMKANAGKTITSDEIHELLDQNPSYIQMCEILEYRGFTIDRGQFARLLLAAVPDLGPSAAAKTPSSGTSAPPTSSAPQISSTPPPSQSGPNRPLPYFIPPSRGVSGEYFTPYGPSHRQPPAPTAPMGHNQVGNAMRNIDPQIQMTPEQRQHYKNGPGKTGPVQPTNIQGMPVPSRPSIRWSDNRVPQINTTKQDLAKKRSFGEIVDLTQALSDEEDVDKPPRQRPRVEGNIPIPDALRQPAMLTRTENDAPLSSLLDPNKDASDMAGTQAPESSSQSLEAFRHKPNDKQYLLRSLETVRPLKKRQDALRRSHYNPKTIGRDFLVAVGRHPTMAPLNSHLDVLRERFMAVDYDSDLATFRWDLVDPGGPPPIPNKAPEKQEERRPSQHHSRVAVVVNGSGGAVQDPAPPKRSHHKAKPTRGGLSNLSTRVGQIPSHDPNTDFSRFVYKDLPSMLNNITGGDITPSQPSQSSTPTSNPSRISMPGRKGRPPGAKNKNPRPDKGVPKSSRSSMSSQETSSFVHQTPTQAQSSPFQTTPSTGSIPTRPRIDTTPAHPSGLRNAMTPTDGIAVVIQSRSPSVAPSQPASTTPRRGRPSIHNNSPKKDPTPAKPSYSIFKCQWDNCPAKLHNLETLRKHVRKHKSGKTYEREGYPCLWRNCYSDHASIPHLPDVNEGGQKERLRFQDEAKWDEHMQGHVVKGRPEDGDIESDADNVDYRNAESKTAGDKGKTLPAPSLSRAPTANMGTSAMKPMVMLP